MSRKAPTSATIKALFAKSQNQCAFPGCTAPLIDSDDLFIGQIAHIRAASSGGVRFDADQDDEDRRQASNLILLCYPHHVSIDRFPDRHSVEELSAIKRSHEQTATENYDIPISTLSLIQRRLNSYWARLGNIATRRIERLEVCVDIDVDSPPHELAKRVIALANEIETMANKQLLIEDIGDDVMFYYNAFQRLDIMLRQLEIVLLHALVVMGDSYDGIDEDITQKQRELRYKIETEVICD